jgi:protein-tyrosine sulfotransferase
MSRIIFLLYESRSGSTLLAKLLDKYEDLGVTIESNFMVNLLMLKPEFEKSRNVAELFSRMENRDRFANFQVDFHDFMDHYRRKEKKGISAFVESVLQSYFAREKPAAQVWIIKDGHNGLYLNQIHDELPEARFIHLIRDGRGVLNSMMKTVKPYGKGEAMARDPLTAARNWRDLVVRIDTFSEKHPGAVLEVRYENLIEDPGREVARVRDYLGLKKTPFPPPGEAGGYYEKLPDREKQIHALLAKDPVKKRIHAWEDELPEASRKLFEYVAGKILAQKGYDSVGPVEMKDILSEPSLRREYFRSILKQYRSRLGYFFNPSLLRKIVMLKLLGQKEPHLP